MGLGFKEKEIVKNVEKRDIGMRHLMEDLKEKGEAEDREKNEMVRIWRRKRCWRKWYRDGEGYERKRRRRRM
jgi:hypothetical protein